MVIALIALFYWVPGASAYEQYSQNGGDATNCGACHGDFRAGSYVSNKDGTPWNDDMHDGHRRTMLNSDCNTCHQPSGRFPVFLNFSTGGSGLAAISCVGCHGRNEDVTATSDRGAGLRQHHWNAGETVCAVCHDDANPANYTPVGEDVPPPYYFTPDTAHPAKPTNPCNIPAGTEAIFGPTGLDNDGDGPLATPEAEDGNDSDCVANTPPVANAGPDQSVFVTDTVTLDGSGSSDIDSDPLTYAWSFTSVPSGSTATLSDPTAVGPTFVVDEPGTYVVQLIVNDGLVDSAPDSVSITTQNSAPVANAGPDQSRPNGATVTLDGSGSSDVDGDPLTYAWSFVSQPAGSTATLTGPATASPTFVIDVSGIYVAQLIVNDGTVDSAPDTVQITTANSAPVANAGPDQSVFVNDLVTLDGSGSSDVDGDTLTYSWTLTSVPVGSGATLSNPAIVNPTFVVDVFGTYVAQLVVNDGTTDSPADTVQITTLNSAPVANAGPDQSVAQFDLVTLDGGGSTDVDGDALTFSWSITSGPDAPALSDPTAVNPTFTASGVGTYTVQLIVNDGTVNSTPDTVQISTTGNTAPVANAGADQSVFVNDTVTLDGSGSSDIDGDPLTYAWSFASRPAGSAAALSDPAAVGPSFVVDVAGTYVVQLIVNDGTLDSAPDQVQINTLNSAPVANAGADQSVFVNDTVTLDGSGSSDVDGDLLTYAWSFTSVPAGSAATLSDPTAIGPTFVVDLPGTYVAQLIVNDGAVNSAPDTVSITTENSAPVANAGPNQTVLIDDLVQLDGSGSTDADGDPLTFSWSFSSRPAGSAATLSDPSIANPTFVVDVSGTYVVQLIVNDGIVNSAPDSVSIATLNSTPVADAGPNQTVLTGSTVTLNGGGSSDADGDPLSYSWTLTSRPVGSGAVLSGATTVNPTFIADIPGTYSARLIVNDGTVNSTPSTVTVTATDVLLAPEIDVSPTAMNFGTVTVGTLWAGTVDIRNLGDDNLSVTGMTLTGSTDFRLNSDYVPPFVVRPGRRISFRVDYLPSDVGADSGTLTILSNDADESTVSMVVDGTGVAGIPDVNVPTAAIDYGDVVAGTRSARFAVIQNVGTGDLTVTGLTTAGSPDFRLNTDYRTPFVVRPGRQVAIRMDYIPSDIGADSGTLTIVSNDPDAPSVAVPLSGNGVPGIPDIDVAPVALDYGDAVVGTRTAGFVTVRNLGNSNLTVTGLSVAGDPVFLLNTDHMPPFTVRAGRQVWIQVDYIPTTLAANSGTLTITSDDPDEASVAVPLSGTGVVSTASTP